MPNTLDPAIGPLVLRAGDQLPSAGRHNAAPWNGGGPTFSYPLEPPDPGRVMATQARRPGQSVTRRWSSASRTRPDSRSHASQWASSASREMRPSSSPTWGGRRPRWRAVWAARESSGGWAPGHTPRSSRRKSPVVTGPQPGRASSAAGKGRWAGAATADFADRALVALRHHLGQQLQSCGGAVVVAGVPAGIEQRHQLLPLPAARISDAPDPRLLQLGIRPLRHPRRNTGAEQRRRDEPPATTSASPESKSIPSSLEYRPPKRTMTARASSAAADPVTAPSGRSSLPRPGPPRAD